MELKPWYSVVQPHEDIRKGRLSEAVFAANLWRVVTGDAPEVYLDTDAFFQKTYLTAGLANVMKKVSRALSGEADAGDRILSLQTSFGGGKTHSLVALWHLAKHTETIKKSHHCEEVRKTVGDELPTNIKGVAVFTHQTCDATQGRQTPEGIHTQTLWGELALQLGGEKLYKKIEVNDRNRTVPQGLFVEILQESAPCLILLDELADYCVGASAVEVGASTLADQTISFVQQLTEAVNQVKGISMIATLPASHLEVASSEKGQEILNSLERRFGRMSSDIKPVADEEIYEVVRRRLFENLGDVSEHEKVADAYLKMYQQHQTEVPTEATKGTYKQHILASYPFHPSLIDALYLRWGSHGDFQRTRGVLRLLASVVGDLWNRRQTETQSQPLVQPCHIRWTIDAMHSALTRLWGAAYESVIAADVIGENANAVILDDERGGEYRTQKITQGLAAAIMLGSFGGQGERAGFSTKDLKICVSRPELNWSYTDGALLTIEERAFYLHTASAGNLGKRYWFGTKPTLNKLIVTYRSQFSTRDFDDEIMRVLHTQVDHVRNIFTSWRVIVNPLPDLPELKALTLLILPPECHYYENGGGMKIEGSVMEQRIMELSRKCGSRERLYRNTLLFLIPSARGLSRLRSTLREVETLEAVKRDYLNQLDQEHQDELKKKLDFAQKSSIEQLGNTFIYVARVEGQQVVLAPVSDPRSNFADHLNSVWKQVGVDGEEWVLSNIGIVTLQKSGLVPSEGGIRVKDAIEAFWRYTDKPMITGKDAVLNGLMHACKEGVIGIGRGVNINDLQRKWCGEYVHLDPSEEGFWIIPLFKKEEETETTKGETKKATGTGGTLPQAPPETGKTPPPETAPGVEVKPAGKQIQKIKISGNVPMESWADIFRSFVHPSSRLNLKKQRLGIDFEFIAPDGQPLDENHPLIKAIKESVRQLGLRLEEE